MSVLRFPERSHRGGVFLSGRTDGGSDILTVYDDDGTELGSVIVGPHMSRRFAGELLERHRMAWRGKAGPRRTQRRRRRRAAGGWAAVIAVTLFAATPWLAGRLGADHGSAAIRPAGPSGFTIDYTPPSALAGDDIEIVGYFRTGEDDWYASPQIGTPFRGHLVRAGRYSYRGSVTLPPQAIYAAFWMESRSGDDRNLGALYHFSDGSLRAELDRLRTIEHLASDDLALWSVFFEAAAALTEAFPSDPEVALLRLAHAKREGLASVEEIDHTVRLIHDRLEAAEDPPQREVEAMAQLAELGSVAWVKDQWSDRVVARYPHSRTARSIAFRVAQETRGPAGILEVADSLWDAEGRLDHDFALAAAQVAELLGRTDVAGRWARRTEGTPE